jgi:hypothetical protein
MDTEFAKQLEEIWKSRTVQWTLPCAFVLAALWAFLANPSPGVAIGILGAAAAIMSLRGDIHIFEKAAWIAIIFALIISEVVAIKRADDKSANERSEQVTKLDVLNKDAEGLSRALKSSIDQSKEQFTANMKEADQVFGKTKEAADASVLAADRVTGGNSFAFVDHIPAGLIGSALLIKIGDAPLYDIHATMTIHSSCQTFPCRGQLSLLEQTVDSLPSGSTMPYGEVIDLHVPNGVPATKEERVFLSIELSARNGKWKEFYWMYTPKNSHYFQHGFRIYRLKTDKNGRQLESTLLRQDLDPCLPEDMLGSDDLAKKHSGSERFYEFHDGRFQFSRASHPCSKYQPKQQ